MVLFETIYGGYAFGELKLIQWHILNVITLVSVIDYNFMD